MDKMKSLTIALALIVSGVSFGGELSTIKAAADRNGCRGELFTILLAIRKAENGGYRREFGILHPRCEAEMDRRPDETLDIQAGWAAATIVKNYVRWEKAGSKGEYIVFLAKTQTSVNTGVFLCLKFGRNFKL